MLTQVDPGLWDALEASKLLTTEQLSAAKKLVSAHEASATTQAVLQTLVRREWLTPFQADRLLKGQSRGFFYDQYKIVDLLGLGGMGWIYRAVDCISGQVVALKALRPGFQHDQGLLARFQQEAKVGLRLHHPYIVQTYCLGSAGGLPYLAMEFVAGPNLHELLLQQQRLPWEQACELARQVAIALSYVHQQRIIHRDIKPQNVLVDAAGHIRLLDFGLSMFQEGETGDEFSLAMIFGHESVGTWEFTAPEQYEDSLAADARSDIYSLGGTLYAALTGTNVFSNRDKSLDPGRKVRSVRESAPETPAEVDAIVSKMLAFHPTDRYACADEVVNALTPWAQVRPIIFDYPTILRDRKRTIELKLANTPSSRATPSSAGRSTARPGEISSVAEVAPQEALHGMVADPAAFWADRGRSPAFSSRIQGPALKWAEETPRDGAAGMVLKFDKGNGRLPLQQDRVVIGRSNQCDLQILDPAVSSRHCELHFDGQQWWITDLESSNGTRVNGKTIKRRSLHSGDQIEIGNAHEFTLHNPREPRIAATGKRRVNILWIFGIFVVAALTVGALIWFLMQP